MKTFAIRLLMGLTLLCLGSCSETEKALAGDYVKAHAPKHCYELPPNQVCMAPPTPETWPRLQFCMFCGRPMAGL